MTPRLFPLSPEHLELASIEQFTVFYISTFASGRDYLYFDLNSVAGFALIYNSVLKNKTSVLYAHFMGSEYGRCAQSRISIYNLELGKKYIPSNDHNRARVTYDARKKRAVSVFLSLGE